MQSSCLLTYHLIPVDNRCTPCDDNELTCIKNGEGSALTCKPGFYLSQGKECISASKCTASGPFFPDDGKYVSWITNFPRMSSSGLTHLMLQLLEHAHTVTSARLHAPGMELVLLPNAAPAKTASNSSFLTAIVSHPDHARMDSMQTQVTGLVAGNLIARAL